MSPRPRPLDVPAVNASVRSATVSTVHAAPAIVWHAVVFQQVLHQLTRVRRAAARQRFKSWQAKHAQSLRAFVKAAHVQIAQVMSALAMCVTVWIAIAVSNCMSNQSGQLNVAARFFFTTSKC